MIIVKFEHVVICYLVSRARKVNSCFSFLSRIMDLKQLINIKFYFKFQKSATETREILKSMYDDNVVILKIVCKWCERFKSRKESSEVRSWRPSTSKTNKKVQKGVKMICSNRRLIIRELILELNMHNILINNLQMRPNMTTRHVFGSRVSEYSHPPQFSHLAPCDS